MDILKDDIEFLKEILEKVDCPNMHDQLEGYQMLRDQISNMQERHLISVAHDKTWPCVFCNKGVKFKRYICGECSVKIPSCT